MGIRGTKALRLGLGNLPRIKVARHASSNAGALSGDRSRDPLPNRAPSKGGFPVQAGLTVGGLALAGDTIAQFLEGQKKHGPAGKTAGGSGAAAAPSGGYDALRALRMTSFGFLFYGPGQKVWYDFLDARLIGKTTKNIAIKVLANQIMLGPVVLVSVFAWNFAWLGKLKELPAKYRRDMGPALVNGWKFWIPASVVNFTVVPLPARVAFMSSCGVFWNFYLSSLAGKS